MRRNTCNHDKLRFNHLKDIINRRPSSVERLEWPHIWIVWELIKPTGRIGPRAVDNLGNFLRAILYQDIIEVFRALRIFHMQASRYKQPPHQLIRQHLTRAITVYRKNEARNALEARHVVMDKFELPRTIVIIIKRGTFGRSAVWHRYSKRE